MTLVLDDDSLFDVGLWTRDQIGSTRNIDECKPAILAKPIAQYGPSQSNDPLFAGSIYFSRNGVVEVSVSDGIGGGGGVFDTHGRYFHIEFHEPNTPQLIIQ